MKPSALFAFKTNRQSVFLIAIILQLFLFLVQFHSADAQSPTGDLIIRSCERFLSSGNDTLSLRLSAIGPDGTVESITSDDLNIDVGGSPLNKDLITVRSDTSAKSRIFVVYENTLSLSRAKLAAKLKDPLLQSKLVKSNHLVNLLMFDNKPWEDVIAINTLSDWQKNIDKPYRNEQSKTVSIDDAIEKVLEYGTNIDNSGEKDVLLLITDSVYQNNNLQTLIDKAHNQGVAIFVIAIATPLDPNPSVDKFKKMADGTGGFVWSYLSDKIESASAKFSDYMNEFLNVIDQVQSVEINLQGLLNEVDPKLNFSIKTDSSSIEKIIDADCSDKFSLKQNNENLELVFQNGFSSQDTITEYYFDNNLNDKRGPLSGIKLIPIPITVDKSRPHIIHVTITYAGNTSTLVDVIPAVDTANPDITPTAVPTPTVEATSEVTKQADSGTAENVPNNPSQDLFTPLLMSVVLLAADFVLFRQVRQARVRYLISHPDAHKLVTLNVTIKYMNSQPNPPFQLTKKTLFIGRSPENEIQLVDDSQTVSRQHGVLIWRNQGWYYSNLKTAQTATVDNKTITGLRLVKIEDYTEIKIGNNLLIFHKGLSPLKPSDMMRTNLPT